MGSVLGSLINLQEVESQLRGVKARLSRAKRVVALQENQLRILTASLEAKQHEIKLVKMEIDSLELELKSRDESLEKYRNALNLAKNNKEYAAILTEINLNKADNSKIENKMLELMKSIEVEEAACAELNSEIDQQQVRVDEAKSVSQAKIAEIEEKITKIEAQWKSTSSGLPAESLLLFQRLSDTYDGEALAFIEISDPRRKSYSCGGCYMALTNETVNQLLSKDEILQCPNCSRIVVLEKSFEH